MATDAQIRQLMTKWRATKTGSERWTAAHRQCANDLSALLSSPVEAEPAHVATINCAMCGWRHTVPCGRDECPHERPPAVAGPAEPAG